MWAGDHPQRARPRDAVIRYNRASGFAAPAGTGTAASPRPPAPTSGVRQPPVGQLQGNHRDPVGPAGLDPAGHLLAGLHVHDNRICAVGGEHPTGVVADNGDNLAGRDISFTGNAIQSSPCR
jgi:hypothetical protein